MKARRFGTLAFALAIAAPGLAGQDLPSSGSLPGSYVTQEQAPPARTKIPTKESAADAARRQIVLPGLDGDQHSLSDWQGKVVVLNFWAAWCGPCQTEIRSLVAYQKEFAQRGLQIIGIGIDAEQPLRNVHRTLAINYPVLVATPESHNGLLQSWGNSTGVIPYTVVIDRDGRVAYTRRGPLERDDLDENVLPLLDRR